jgi:hypothetical protein
MFCLSSYCSSKNKYIDVNCSVEFRKLVQQFLSLQRYSVLVDIIG